MPARIFLDEIPYGDFSRGVFLFGSSNLGAAFMDWRGEASAGFPFRNLAIGGASHRQQLHLIQYLAKSCGFLAGGAEQTLVVLGLYYANAHRRKDGVLGRAFPRACERYGLYKYDRVAGLSKASNCVQNQ